jgi:hypothetical protein
MRKSFLPFLIVMPLLTSCYNEDDAANIFDPSKYATYIQPRVDRTSMLADGRSIANILVHLPVETDSDKRTITFETTLGTFPEGTDRSITVRVDSIDTADRSKRVVKFRLRSGQNTGKARITTKYFGIAQTPVFVDFTTAYPTAGAIEADRFSIQNTYSSEATLTASLGRIEGGKPSIGRPVRFEVVDQANRPRALFRAANLSTNADGKASVIIAINDTTFTGTLTIRAKFATNESNDSLTVTNTLLVTP